MTDRETLNLALDALESASNNEGNFHDYRYAATALRQAIEQAEKQEPVALDPLMWTPCVKLPIVVHVRQQRAGEAHVSTREGITPVKPDDLIMRGVAGEEYPIGRELFERTYTFDAAPPKREWVGLTGEERKEFSQWAHIDVVEDIETTLRDKNGF